jgi:hypothetical protein
LNGYAEDILHSSREDLVNNFRPYQELLQKMQVAIDPYILHSCWFGLEFYIYNLTLDIFIDKS